MSFSSVKLLENTWQGQPYPLSTGAGGGPHMVCVWSLIFQDTLFELPTMTTHSLSDCTAMDT